MSRDRAPRRPLAPNVEIYDSLREACEAARDEDVVQYCAEDGDFWQVVRLGRRNLN